MYVNPRKDCPHIVNGTFLPLEQFKNVYFKNAKCEFCSETNELWICISCGKFFCGRYVNNHFYDKHFSQDNSHCICISMLDLSVWCYQCSTDGFKDLGSYIDSHIANDYVNIISDFKFGGNSNSNNILNSNSFMTKEQKNKIKYGNFIELLKNDKFKKISFLIGPGINLDETTGKNIIELIFSRIKSKLPNQINHKNLFEKDTFNSNPNYLYTFLKELKLNENEYLKPNIIHYFIRLILDKNLGNFIFTENFDGNEEKAGISPNNLVYARENLKEGHCFKCNQSIDINIINKGINEELLIKCDKCGGICKPKVTLDGGEYNNEFYTKCDNILQSDLVFIIGSDFCDMPFVDICEVLTMNNPWVVLINDKEIKGKYQFFDIMSKNLYLQGKCDEIVKKMVTDLGWKDDIANKYNFKFD